MKKEKMTIIFILLIVVVVGFLVYSSFGNKNKKPNNQTETTKQEEKKEETKKDNQNTSQEQEETKQEEKKEEITINYNSLKKELIARIDNDPNTNAYLETCSNFERNRKTLSVTSVEKLIEKLMTSTSIEKVSTSMTCPNYTYTVSTNIDNDMTRENIIIAMYANDPKVLLVGIKGEGYAFKFDTNLSGFLENLE